MVPVLALLVKAKLPPSHPAAVGAKVMSNAAVCPAPSTMGSFKSCTENSPDVEVTEEIVTLADSVFVKAMGKDSDCPITMLPKCSCDGLLVTCAALALELAASRASSGMAAAKKV